MQFFAVGVDGGASKTEAVALRVDGTVIGFVKGEGCNFNAVGEENARDVLECIVEELISKVVDGTLISMVLSLSGITSSSDVMRWTEWAQGRWLGVGIKVCNDVEAALASGTRGLIEGVVCIAGTGMNVMGIHPITKIRTQIGGLGPFLGDYASGYCIGNQVLEKCARAEDGRGLPTSLVEHVLLKIGVSSIRDIVGWRYDPIRNWKDIAEFAPLAFQHAEECDLVAQSIVRDTCIELSNAILLALDQIGECTVVFAGGLWEHRILMDTVTLNVLQRYPHAIIIRPSVPPCHGAALMGLREHGQFT